MSSPRRTLLRTLGAVALAPDMAGAGLPTASPDADLLAACAEHMRLAEEEERLYALMLPEPVSNPSGPLTRAWGLAGEASYAALDKVLAIPAQSLHAAAAKARSVRALRISMRVPDEDRDIDAIAAGLVLDEIARLTGGGL